MYYSRKIEGQLKKNLSSKQAIIVTGMRRVGKTTVLRELYNAVPDNKIWFDFENPLDVKYFEDIDYNEIYQNIVQKGNLNTLRRMYVFIDEVQLYPNISKIVKYLIDHYKVKFLLTGSASYYLKNLFPESLAGRKIIFEMYPLDFEEFLIFKKENEARYQKIKNKKNISELDYELYDAYYREFVEWGGFPEVALTTDKNIKQQRLEDIFGSYYQQEIINLADYRKGNKVRDLIMLLAARVGSQLDLVKLSQELQIQRTTVYSYLAFLKATYFIHLVSRLSSSIDREVSGTQKVYFCDNGILKVMSGISAGQLLENTVYNQLKTKGSVSYFRKKSGAEIDFILNKKTAYEVKRTASPVDVHRIARVQRIAKLSQSFVVSQQYVKTGKDGVVFGQFL
ncbi:MAG: ATP-binding protein [Candidatus Magasanikbacteria bacterium]|nr:ATP-binding protein [Candidatus Magasanikbacteria bacterium]